MAESYARTTRNSINRLKQRASYDHGTIHGILDSAPVLHVSFNPTSFDDDPFPTILPMLGCTGTFTPPTAEETSAVAVYLHGHSASRFIKSPSKGTHEDLPGVPVCIAATHFDGVVLALTPFNHSCNYRSAIVHGWANVVTDEEEKKYALKLITDNLVPERWDNSRVPPTEAEMKATGVLRVDIVSASAKIRAYTAGNDRVDLQDSGDGEVQKMRERVWTGVVPVSLNYGTPVAAEENLMRQVPTYLQDWIKSENETGGKYARDIALLKGPAKS